MSYVFRDLDEIISNNFFVLKTKYDKKYKREKFSIKFKTYLFHEVLRSPFQDFQSEKKIYMYIRNNRKHELTKVMT